MAQTHCGGYARRIIFSSIKIVMKAILRIAKSIDWVLLAALGMVIFFGLVTMKSFGVHDTTAVYFFNRQLIWLAVGLFVFVVALFVDWSFLRTNSIFLILG